MGISFRKVVLHQVKLNLQFSLEENGNLPFELCSLATEGTQEFQPLKKLCVNTLSMNNNVIYVPLFASNHRLSAEIR